MKLRVKEFLMVSVIATFSVGLFSCGGGSSNEEKKANDVNAKGKPEIEWVSIPGGTFLMGSLENEKSRKADEVQHEVTLSPFKMSKYEVTVAQFKSFVDATGYQTLAETGKYGFKGSSIWIGGKYEKKEGVNWRHDMHGNLVPDSNYNHPVTNVTWDDAIAFSKWMGCKLPTEAQWEYAARGGMFTPFNTGTCLSTDQANYNGNIPGANCKKGIYRNKTLKVGSFPANTFGLHDMHGNVSEWVFDVYSDYPTTPQTNPTGPSEGSDRVTRGGGWQDNSANCRSAARKKIFHGRVISHIGFRLVTNK
jgi:formylglycine-generating enzyme required for sulfatase activity